ncbi:MAG: GEVED domain-containing protein, partial [Armatimonadetes bacterium]|nr:GEVED domain-containing protein [Armatimonadota bacterium]
NPLIGPDDEDGVFFLTPLVPGQPAIVNVIASAAGMLDVWVDFNGNGSWADLGDQIFSGQPLVAGNNTLTFIVPGPGVPWPTMTYARFRFSSIGGLPFFGPAPDGEVEDYMVRIEPIVGTLTFSTNKPIKDHFWWPSDPDQYNEMLSLTVSADWVEPIRWDSITLQFIGGLPGNIMAADIWQDMDLDGQVDVPGDVLLGSIPMPSGTVTTLLSSPPVIPASGSICAIVSYKMSPATPPMQILSCVATAAVGKGQISLLPAAIAGLPLTSANKITAPDPITIGQAKKLLPFGPHLVFLKDKELTADLAIPVWPAPWNWFYIEEPTRASGIGVMKTTLGSPLSIGDNYSVLGWTQLFNTAELMVNPFVVLTETDTPTIAPLGMNNKATGGGAFGAQPGVWNKLTPLTPGTQWIPATSLNNVGSLIRTWGNVTGYGGVELTPGNWVDVFWIDDGTYLMDGYTTNAGEPSHGIAVVTPSGIIAPPVGMYVVTGILKAIPATAPYGVPIRLLVPRSISDLTPHP